MRIVTMIPLTKSAKQIVRKNGDRWEVLRREMSVLFTDNPGPFLLVMPLSEERAPATNARAARVDTASRWVHEFSDDDFKIAP